MLGMTNGGNIEIAKDVEIKAYSTYSSMVSDTPDENTIGVVTSVPVSSYTVSTSAPTSAVGKLWIHVEEHTSFPGVQIKLTERNPIYIYPRMAEQYYGGSWHVVSLGVYRNSRWNIARTYIEYQRILSESYIPYPIRGSVSYVRNDGLKISTTTNSNQISCTHFEINFDEMPPVDRLWITGYSNILSNLTNYTLSFGITEPEYYLTPSSWLINEDLRPIVDTAGESSNIIKLVSIGSYSFTGIKTVILYLKGANNSAYYAKFYDLYLV